MKKTRSSKRGAQPVPATPPVPRFRASFDRLWLEHEVLLRLLPGFEADPDAVLMAAAERLGIGPLLLFDAAWYRERHGLAPDDDALTHYVTVGGPARLDPHPLFDTAHYLRVAPEAAAPGTNPLQHFVDVGGPAGLDCHPLLRSRWYWNHNADVLVVRMIPMLHYLKYGGQERRDPNPMFDSRFYAQQAKLDRFTNPLAHFVANAGPRGPNPHPSFRPAAVCRAFKRAGTAAEALGAYLDLFGPDLETGLDRLGDGGPEPGIRPAPGPLAPLAPGRATLQGTALLDALGLGSVWDAMPVNQVADYRLGKLQSAYAVPDMPAELAAAMALAQAGPAPAPSTDRLLHAIGLLPQARLAQPPPSAPAGILDRYEALRHAVTERFRLDPARAGTAAAGPTISIMMPVYRPPLHVLERAVLSVVGQTHRAWELCVVDDCSDQPGLTAALAAFAAADPRIRVGRTERNGGISAASNLALSMATGEYVGLLDHDDLLTRDALALVADRLRTEPDADLLYSDECTIDEHDIARDLFAKPDWSPMLLTSMMYTGHFSVYRTALLRDLGGFRSAYDFSQDYDLALRAAERMKTVLHLREYVYGWRMIAGSAAVGDKPTARTTNIAALQDAMDRRRLDGTAVALPTANRALRPPGRGAPTVSVIIPSDTPGHILQAVMSLAAHTAYPHMEVVVVAGSSVIRACEEELADGAVRFVAYDKPFNFSDKCNRGAAAASGSVLVFLNDDVRVLTPDWVEAILECLTLPGVGAVGPKLLYENGTIQHAGMVTGTRRLVSTAFHAFPGRTGAHFNMAQCVREVSLLSGACLAMTRPVFERLGGFDAVNVPIAHSDVDLCLRLRETGLSCVYTPHATLVHVGHASIGAAEESEGPWRADKSDLFLMRRFGPMLADDPFFPPGMRDLLSIGDQVSFAYHPAPERPRAGQRDVLLVSHDLSGSGAPRIVYDMARVLCGAEWTVVVISPEDGAYRDRLLAVGADVIIEPGALSANAATVEFARNFDMVIANTILCWPLMPALAGQTRTVLYAHESALVEQVQAAHPEFVDALQQAGSVWAGSERAAAALRLTGVMPIVLEYGVEAMPHAGPRPARAVVISVFATMEPRKGQDLAVQGFLLLPPEVRSRCQLRLVGRSHDLPFEEGVRAFASGHPDITFTGPLSLEDYQAALLDTDIVLCPSRDDTLPLVSLNALAAGRVLVCSAEVGTSAYLRDGESGFIMPSIDPPEVGATLVRVMAGRRRWPQIGAAARQVFESEFSLQRFNDRLLAMLEPTSPTVQAAE